MNKLQRFVSVKAPIMIALFVLLGATVSAQFGPPPAQPLLVISEFRLRGTGGANDEFVEIYNNSNKPHTVAPVDGSTGYALVASDGVARCVIPTGTIIPARGHFLCVNVIGYALASYPASDGTATGDAGYIANIPDNAGIALFNSSNHHYFTLANRIDAVGSTAEANSLYKEGVGYPALTPYSTEFSLYRDNCGKHGDISNFAPCTAAGRVVDTNNNANDFIFADTNGTYQGVPQLLGTPGPENLSSPVYLGVGSGLTRTPLDPLTDLSTYPNRSREETPFPNLNSTFGILTFRRVFTNNTSAPITRLRFRVIDLTTFAAAVGVADLRPLSCADAYVLTNTGVRLVRGTTLEQPPQQPNGGGFNSSLSANAVSTAAPLLPGASINLQFVFGIQQMGAFRFAMIIETLPATGSSVWAVSGNTETRNDIEP